MATNKIFKRFTGSAWEEFKFAAFDSEKLGGVLPSGYALASHSHSIANITGLQAALNGKLSTTGNAATATKLATPVNINGVAFDGSSSITITAAPTSHNQTYTTINDIPTGHVLGRNSSGTGAAQAITYANLKSYIGLGNVDNQSKATMFTNPTFTGTVSANNLMYSSSQGIQFEQDKISFLLDNSIVAEFDDMATTFTVNPRLMLNRTPTLAGEAATKGYVDTGLSGKLGTGGTAADAYKLGGQLPAYYQPALTAITTSNIANQSVNYAASAGSVSNGVYTTGSYSNPSWITSLAATKISGTLTVGKGGTGATTFASGNVLIGAGTGAITTLSRSGIDSRTAFPTTWANISGTTPTWNQDTIGNAATATLAADSSKLGGQTKTQLFTDPNFTGTVRANNLMYSTYQGIQFSQDKIGFMLDNSIVAEFDDNENTFTVSPRMILSGAPILTNQAATKGYVDDKINENPLGNTTVKNLYASNVTLALSDAGITFLLPSASTVSIPINTSVNFPIGTEINFIRMGTGEITFSPSSGVTLYSEGSKRKINAQYQAATLKKTSANTWILIGALKS